MPSRKIALLYGADSPNWNLEITNKKSGCFPVLIKFYQENKQHAVAGLIHGQTASVSVICKDLLKKNNWNETWDLKIIQAESRMQICPESRTDLGDIGAWMTLQIWGKWHEARLQVRGDQPMFCRHDSFYQLSLFLLVFSISLSTWHFT